MIEPPPPTLRLNIDTRALAANWRALDRLSGGARAGAAVKASCYGLGVDICVPVLRDAGARDFFVAHWSEVPEVAKHVPTGSIAVLHGPLTPEDARFAVESEAIPVINSLHQAAIWNEHGVGLPCHLMVDTGINRLGLSLDNLSSELVRRLDVRVLMSHLSSAEEESLRNQEQLRRFEQARQVVKHREASLVNGAGVMLGPPYHFDLTRPGLSLYGGALVPELEEVIAQVAYPQAAIIQRRVLRSGEAAGYNAAFVANRDIEAAIVSVGYADGFLRCWGERGALYTDGTALPILGKVSMDMVIVDISCAPDLAEGDWLDLPYDLPRASRLSGLSQYELLTVLGRRFAS